MFSGIVQQMGRVRDLHRTGDSAVVEIESGLEGLELGASVAVNGVCLTVAEARRDGFRADLVFTTLAKTTLGALAPGTAVNLETALRLNDVVGGHLIQGHVDGVGQVIDKHRVGEGISLRISCPSSLGSQLIPHGSIAVDGISLTVSEFGPDWFSVALVPHTVAATIASAYGPGTRVNLEADMIGKYVARLLAGPATNPVNPLGGI